MMRLLSVLCFVLIMTTAAIAQLETRFSAVVEFSSFSAITDSVTTGDVINWSDPLNGGYLPSQIQVGFRVVDAAGRMYRVQSLNSSTFSDANVTLVEMQDQNTTPTGQGTIFEPTANYNLIPSAVANALGVTPKIRSDLDINNTVVIDSLLKVISDASGGGTALNDTTLTVDGTSMFIRYFGSTAPTLTEPAAGNYTLTEPTGTQIRGFDFTGNNTDVDGSGDLTLTLDSTDGNVLYQVVQVINQGNDQIADLPTLGINVEQVDGAGSVATTLTGMSGFGASGFTILFRVP